MAVRLVSNKRRSRLEVDTRQFMATIREMARQASPVQRRKYLKNVGNIILAQQKRIFQGNGQPLGVLWKPLRPATISRNPRRKGGQVLRDTGRLRASVSLGKQPGGTHRGKAKMAIRDTDNNSVTIGTNLHYAKTHQYGRRRMKGHVRAHTRRAAGAYTKGGKIKKSVVRDRLSTLGGRKYLRGLGGSPSSRLRSLIIQVRAHGTTLPAIPARPFAGWTRGGIEQALELAYEFFVITPTKKTKRAK